MWSLWYRFFISRNIPVSVFQVTRLAGAWVRLISFDKTVSLSVTSTPRQTRTWGWYLNPSKIDFENCEKFLIPKTVRFRKNQNNVELNQLIQSTQFYYRTLKCITSLTRSRYMYPFSISRNNRKLDVFKRDGQATSQK